MQREEDRNYFMNCLALVLRLKNKQYQFRLPTCSNHRVCWLFLETWVGGHEGWGVVEHQVSVQTGAHASLEAELHTSLQHDRIGTVGEPSAQVLLLSIQISHSVKTSQTQHKQFITHLVISYYTVLQAHLWQLTFASVYCNKLCFPF